MSTVIITLQDKENRIDLELPSQLPLAVLAPILAEKLAWDSLLPDYAEIDYVGHVVTSGLVIRPDDTLAKVGVVHGDVMELVANRRQTQVLTNDLPTVHDRVALLQAAATGETFPCPGRTNLIGRVRHCVVNVNHLPDSDATSRQHANLLQRPDGYWLRDERSLNGTIVDGVMLPSGGQVRLRHGCRIQLGKDGPLLIFMDPKA
ncbi:MAG: FHA domain-containing protein [Anaerolineae bacterium]|nr:FHA domain-containing protein [Anaerolineae bacterium]